MTDDLLKNLAGLNFNEYYSTLRALRSNPERLDTIDSETVDCICRAFELYRFGYRDILEIKREALKVLNKHLDNVKDRSLINGVKRYIEGYLRHEHDSSGFIYVAGCVKIAAKIDLDKIIEVLEAKHPDDVEVLTRYKKFLRKMESAGHNAYYILREIGDRFLPNLEKIIYRLVPSNQDTILHALEVFVGNKEVIDFYNRYKENAAFEWLKEDAENYLQNVREGN